MSYFKSIKLIDNTDAPFGVKQTGNAIHTLIDDNGGSITVDGSLTVSASNLDIRDLTSVSDSVKIGDADGDFANVEDRKQTPTGKALNVQIGPGDPISNIPVVMLYDHHQIHEGETWRWSTLQTGGLNAGSNYDIVFTVPSLSSPALVYAPHFRFEVVADSYSTAFFYEGVSNDSTAGSARTPINMERNGSYTPKLQITDGTSGASGTTLLWQGLITGSKSSAGSADTSSTEFILKSGTKYLFRFTSGTTGCKYLLRFIWYEDLGV